MGKNLLLWLIIAAVLLTVFNNFNMRPEPATLSYSDFIQQVRSDEVVQVEIDGLIIRGANRAGEQFQVVRPDMPDQKLLDDLYNHNVTISGKMPEQQSIWAQLLIASFPILIIIAVFMLFMRQMQGGAGGRGGP
ncbi:MAG: ATP-dependent metallopeptidase FtsH/Yme1/Tma family protein, partial [Burkholderiales bacterium]|nr:ATP-dependent metallopeptidase FtsH/Yme1/Tma family protein [Burkholderiales bacterium]